MRLRPSLLLHNSPEPTKAITMKHFAFFAALLLSLVFSTGASAQWAMTFSAGLSPMQTPETPYIFVNRSSPRDEFIFDLAQVKASYFIGAGVTYDVNPFFFSAEALFNQREFQYNVSYTFPGFGRTEEVLIYEERMNVINIPLSLGVDLGAVDVTSGFLPQIIISQDSDLRKIIGYSQKLSPIRLGWHSGVMVHISNLRIGFNWQMDFNNYVDHASIRDQPLTLQGNYSRLLGTMSYKF